MHYVQVSHGDGQVSLIALEHVHCSRARGTSPQTSVIMLVDGTCYSVKGNAPNKIKALTDADPVATFVVSSD